MLVQAQFVTFGKPHGFGSVAKSGSFGPLSSTAPAAATSNTVTLTYLGPNRNFSLSYGGAVGVDLERNINGGGFANYTVPFAVPSGQTLAFRVNAPTSAGSETISIFDDSTGELVETASVTVS
jgi:hypothetical protein